MYIFKSVILFTIVFANILQAEELKSSFECTSSKEYITTLNFLREKKELGITEKFNLELADFVSNGCTGAADRFIKITNLLINAEIPSQKALNVAKTISHQDDKTALNFQNIFKKVYLENFFDLPADKSLSLATELTIKMDKDSSKIIEDFNLLSDFCLNKNSLDLGIAICADIIQNVLIKTKNQNVNIAKEFIDLIEFLTNSEKGPKFITAKALIEAQKTVEFGPLGISNFMTSFQFAKSENGLKMGNAEAILFAQKMAMKTLKK